MPTSELPLKIIKHWNENIETHPALAFGMGRHFQTYVNSGWHTHEYKHQITYVLDGKIELSYNDDTLILGTGSAVCIPAGLEHSFISFVPGTKIFALYLDAEAYDVALKDFACFDIKNLLIYLYSWCTTSKKIGDFLVSHSHASQAKADALIRIEPRSDMAVELRSLLENRICTKLEMDEIANQYGFSRRTMRRYFERGFGVPFKQTYDDIRALAALRLLVLEDENRATVAQFLGYAESISVTRLLRNRLNINAALLEKFQIDQSFMYSTIAGHEVTDRISHTPVDFSLMAKKQPGSGNAAC